MLVERPCKHPGRQNWSATDSWRGRPGQTAGPRPSVARAFQMLVFVQGAIDLRGRNLPMFCRCWTMLDVGRTLAKSQPPGTFDYFCATLGQLWSSPGLPGVASHGEQLSLHILGNWIISVVPASRGLLGPRDLLCSVPSAPTATYGMGSQAMALDERLVPPACRDAADPVVKEETKA